MLIISLTIITMFADLYIINNTSSKKIALIGFIWLINNNEKSGFTENLNIVNASDTEYELSNL